MEYDEMVVQRRENDKEIEEVREEANQVEVQVCPVVHHAGATFILYPRWPIISK